MYDVTLTVVDDAGLSASRTTRAYVTGAGVDADGTLEFVGTAGGDAAYVKSKNGQVIASGAFIPGWHRVHDPANLTGLLVLTGDGNDKVDVYDTVTLNAIVDGGAGDDVLWGGGGRNLLIGCTGGDEVNGGAAADILVAGSTVLDGDPAALRGVLLDNNPLAGLTLDDDAADVLDGYGGADTFHAALEGGGVLDEVLYLQEQYELIDVA
ncbi:MAG TPA: hypothetical protein VFB66_00795 [Tepidisphaeraceae bacterium]|nr:hypothetical protein [Tepidisphaeraceae bacterium]